MDETKLRAEIRRLGGFARNRRRNSIRASHTARDHELRPLLCKQCGRNEEMVPGYMDAVICWRCTAKNALGGKEPNEL